MKLTWDIFGIFSNNVKSFLLEFKLQNHKNPRQFLIIKQKLQNLPNVFLQLSWRADWTAQPFLHWSFSHSIFNSLHWAPISKVRGEDANLSSTFYKTRFSFKLSLSWISLLHLFGTQWAKRRFLSKIYLTSEHNAKQPQRDLNDLLIDLNSLKLASKVSK